VSACVCG